MKNPLIKSILWFSVFTLALELPIATIAGQGLKLWILSALAAGLILLWGISKKGFAEIQQSKLFLFGVGFVFFSLLGLLNSPQKGYSLKQIVVLGALIALGIFFEVYGKKKSKIIYSALAAGLLVSAIAAIYQNFAFTLGWPHFEVMDARPNAFFPEADWLGMYMALGIVPFIVLAGKDRQKSKLPKILQNKYSFYLFLLLTFTGLVITVARASWLALIAEVGIIIFLPLYYFVIPAKAGIQKDSEKLLDSHWSLPRALSRGGNDRKILNQFFIKGLYFFSLFAVSLTLINIFHLSRFNVPDRFRSIFFREHIITVAENPTTGENFKINLEEIEKYRAQGYLIKENYITDENVTSREEKVASTWDIIKSHPILGSGQGITLINTNYQHNANNLFLEWWASAGLGGLALIVSLLIYLLVKGFLLLKYKPQSAMIIIAGTAGFIIVNLFNASIFLAFAWFYLAWLLGKQETGSKK